jgi:hypothetical protein
MAETNDGGCAEPVAQICPVIFTWHFHSPDMPGVDIIEEEHSIHADALTPPVANAV